jgi:hypothetical protein
MAFSPDLSNTFKERYLFNFKTTAAQSFSGLYSHIGVVGVVGSNPAAPIGH